MHWQKTKCYKPMANNITTLIPQKAVLGDDIGGSRREHDDAVRFIPSWLVHKSLNSVKY